MDGDTPPNDEQSTANESGRRESLRAEALAFRRDLERYSASVIVTAVLHSEARKSVEKHGGELPLAEYLALLLSEQLQVGGGMTPSFEAVEDAAIRAYRIFDAARSADPIVTLGDDGRPVETFEQRFRMEGLFMRNPGVPEHWAKLLDVFAREFDPELQRALPFSLKQAVQIIQALQQTMIRRSVRRRVDAHARAEAAWATYRRTRNGRITGDTFLDNLFSRIREEHLRPRKTIFEFFETRDLTGIDELAFIDLAETAASAHIDEAILDEFLALFTLKESLNDDWLLIPSSHNPLTRTPFLKTPRGYFVPYLPLLQWALLPRVEEILNPDSRKAINASRKVWERYEDQRSKFLEQTAARLVGTICKVEPKLNVAFTLDGKQGEIDVVVPFDTTTFVIECKSTTIDPATRRGAAGSLASDVRDILGKSSAQLARYIRYVKASEEGDDGRRSDADFVPLIVTLDHSSAIAAGIRAAGYAKATDQTAPWVLSLLGLYTLLDLLETPWRLKHYARRRLLAINERREVMAFDELDFYQNYLYFNVCAMPPGGSHFLIVAPSDDVDNYYNSLNPHRPKKPIRFIPLRLLHLINDLERSMARGWSDVVCDLLDLSFDASDALERSIGRLQGSISTTGGTAAWRFRQPDVGYGLVYIATREAELSMAIVRAQLSLPDVEPEQETYLVIAHDSHSGRVRTGVYRRSRNSWSREKRHALGFGEEGMFLSVSDKDRSPRKSPSSRTTG